MPVPVIESVAQSSGATTPFTATMPSGIQNDDVLIGVELNSFNGTCYSSGWTAGSGGFTSIGSETGSTGDGCGIAMWYRVANGNESDRSLTRSSSLTNWVTRVRIYRVSGLDTENLIETSTTKWAGEPQSTDTSPSVSVSEPNTFCLTALVDGDSSVIGTHAFPDGTPTNNWIQNVAVRYNFSPSYFSYGVAYQILNSGSTGTCRFTEATSSAGYVAMTLAMNALSNRQVNVA